MTTPELYPVKSIANEYASHEENWWLLLDLLQVSMQKDLRQNLLDHVVTTTKTQWRFNSERE